MGMPNRLASATSPYLLQHQDNPVEWWEWSEEAFATARDRDVPVLLSVGYAACHWCHVMAHESFEDPETAARMNDLFVNVKVDREERPDVDSIYMEAVQAMSGHGGWPMTVWIDHDGRPFFAGTYFPREPRHGMASFNQVIDAVSSAWLERRDQVEEQARRLLEAISTEIPKGLAPTEETIKDAYSMIEASFDHRHGGFGIAPKFPQQPIIEFLLRAREEPWATKADEMVGTTLTMMALGGIHDHVGGGFSRYSVDERWLVPHFEKMLYDNAQLARLYLWAGIELERDDLLRVARSTLDYLAADLRHPEGGFYSSEDADSEGEEGKFYVWARSELEGLVGQAAAEAFGATDEGNFEGHNILTVERVMSPDLVDARRLLHEARSQRVRPGLDDKIVTGWNGLAIRAFAEAGAALMEQRYLDLAEACASFLMGNLFVDGNLMRSWRDGRTSVPGFLEDNASLAVGLFSLYSATGDEEWYLAGIERIDQLSRFERAGGGYHSTMEDSGALVKRPVDMTDNPLPSGNALAAEALLIASLYTGKSEWRDKSDAAIGAAGLLVERYPSMVGHHLSTAYSARKTKELAIVGPDWKELARVYWSRHRPHVALAGSASGTSVVPLLEGRVTEEGALAFVCEDFVCALPTSDPVELSHQL